MRAWKAVIFDMDGLMLDTEILSRRAWNRAMADWNLVIPDVTFRKMVGRTIVDVAKILQEDLQADLPIDQIVQRRSEYLEEQISQVGISLKPGLIDLLDWLEERHIPKAVASSTVREMVVHKLSVVALGDRFQAIVSRDEITRGKPAPDVFLSAARDLAVPPRECVALEDSDPGIVAAHAAGMIPIMVPDQFQPTAEAKALAYAVLPSLVDVRQLLEASLAQSESPNSRLTNTSS